MHEFIHDKRSYLLQYILDREKLGRVPQHFCFNDRCLFTIWHNSGCVNEEDRMKLGVPLFIQFCDQCSEGEMTGSQSTILALISLNPLNYVGNESLSLLFFYSYADMSDSEDSEYPENEHSDESKYFC